MTLKSRVTLPRLEPPSLFCGVCRTWLPVNRGLVAKVGADYWVCDGCERLGDERG